MIPKVIHYCWFGSGELPEKDKKCIESWKKYCPDYEIRLWNESNYDVKKNRYMYQAYKARKWGFVPDFARLDIIYNYGGIYLDTDVELVKNIDNLLNNEAYMGFEKSVYINPGLGFGAVPRHKGIKKILDIYNDLAFVKEDGTLNTTPSPIMNTRFLMNYGVKMEDREQEVLGIKIYPSDYLCPMDYATGEIFMTQNTCSIHRYSMSWIDPATKKWKERERAIARKIGKEKAKKLIRFVSFPDRVMQKVKTLGFKKTISLAVGKLRKDK